MKLWALTIIAALVVAGLGGVLIKSYGSAKYDAGHLAAVAEINMAAVARAKKEDVKEYEIRKLSDDDLVRRYCRFVYGGTYDLCIRTVKPID